MKIINVDTPIKVKLVADFVIKLLSNIQKNINIDSIFIGNVIQRIYRETGNTGDICHGKTKYIIKKENAILYRSKNGLYADLEELNKFNDIKKIDKIVDDQITVGAFITKSGIRVMRGLPLSQAENIPIAKEFFVDSNSLKPYKEFKDPSESANFKVMKKTRNS